MSEKEFIESELSGIKSIQVPNNLIGLTKSEAIKKQLLSNKFRKYSATPEFISKVESAIKYNVERNQPINLTLPHGAYKLWRLKSAPEADWAELFAHMYYTHWLKPICDIYEPGVVLDCYLDDIMLEKLNNIPRQDITKYQQSYQNIMDFLRPHRPKNFISQITTVSSRLPSTADLFTAVDEKLKKIKPRDLTEGRLRTIKYNHRDGDSNDFDFTKISHLEDAYQAVKADIGYRDSRPDNIPIWFEKHPSRLAVGSTKNSIMKFWIASGVLLKDKKKDTYKPTILSSSQLEKHKLSEKAITIDGLSSQNFRRIITAEKN